MKISLLRITPILPTIALRSATTWSPTERTKYPPLAATSPAKVKSFRLFFLAKVRILLLIISLCTGSPPGEFTETASATAREVLIYESLLATLSVLNDIFI